MDALPHGRASAIALDGRSPTVRKGVHMQLGIRVVNSLEAFSRFRASRHRGERALTGEA
jgi:hypothetical protein